MNRNRTWLLVITAVVGMLVLAGASASAAEKEHFLKVGKKGEATFDKETKVGDLTLKPGRYFFQHRVEGDDHFVHFTQVTEREYWRGGTGGDVPKVHPGEVKCRLEPLSSKVTRTAVYLGEEGGTARVTRIEVAGENAAHVF